VLGFESSEIYVATYLGVRYRLPVPVST